MPDASTPTTASQSLHRRARGHLAQAGTPAQRARHRATSGRIRAYVRMPGKNYDVYSHGVKYCVWYNYHTQVWECTCPARPPLHYTYKLCKHIQRVIDREERRIKAESLAYEREHNG